MTPAPAPPARPVTAEEAEALFAALATRHRLLVALSGGPDSVALLALLAEWCTAAGRPTLHAATVDHALRPESAAEAQAAGDLARRFGVPHAVLRWDADKPQAGLQERARAARYDLLGAHAAGLGAAALVTAHTLDDQAETLLMRLSRGSGLAGLAGMAAESRRDGMVLLRPLLELPKRRLVATCEARGLAFARDPSNVDPRFTRARWRDLMPALAAEGLTAERLARLAGRLSRADAALDRQARMLLPTLLVADGAGGARLDVAALAREPEEIVLRILAAAMAAAGARSDAPAMRLERLEALVAALLAARAAGRAMTRTFSGLKLAMDAKGLLVMLPEPARRRGVHLATQ